ncbi:MAG: hypothetical protein Q7T29_14570 [Gallionella sp.]|nr:hypothetical protein [Gallionella sp.]
MQLKYDRKVRISGGGSWSAKSTHSGIRYGIGDVFLRLANYVLTQMLGKLRQGAAG